MLLHAFGLIAIVVANSFSTNGLFFPWLSLHVSCNLRERIANETQMSVQHWVCHWFHYPAIPYCHIVRNKLVISSYHLARNNKQNKIYENQSDGLLKVVRCFPTGTSASWLLPAATSCPSQRGSSPTCWPRFQPLKPPPRPWSRWRGCSSIVFGLSDLVHHQS